MTTTILIFILIAIYLTGVISWCCLSYKIFYEFNFETIIFSIIFSLFGGPILPLILLGYQFYLEKRSYRTFLILNKGLNMKSTIGIYVVILLVVACYYSYKVYSEEEYITVYKVQNVSNMSSNEMDIAVNEYSNYISRVKFFGTNTAKSTQANINKTAKEFSITITNEQQLIELFSSFLNYYNTNKNNQINEL